MWHLCTLNYYKSIFGRLWDTWEYMVILWYVICDAAFICLFLKNVMEYFHPKINKPGLLKISYDIGPLEIHALFLHFLNHIAATVLYIPCCPMSWVIHWVSLCFLVNITLLWWVRACKNHEPLRLIAYWKPQDNSISHRSEKNCLSL